MRSFCGDIRCHDDDATVARIGLCSWDFDWFCLFGCLYVVMFPLDGLMGGFVGDLRSGLVSWRLWGDGGARAVWVGVGEDVWGEDG